MSRALWLVVVWSAITVLPDSICAAEPAWRGVIGLEARTPWTTSRIVGSPDPPPPYRIERIYPGLSFQQPVEMVPFPEGNRVAVVERAGRVLTFVDAPDAAHTDLLLDGSRQIAELQAIYGLAFHPQFAANQYCYLCYITGSAIADGTRVSRFRVTATDPPQIDPGSETILLTFLSGGHNGGSLKFGPDGFLYISTGDAEAPDPPDRLSTGQNISDLLSSVLRIDVDHPAGDRPYAVPADNPFIQTADARPEVWAYGFRNPWRMSFDRATGDLWLGDVGWQLFEMVYRVERGGNYGWSVMEGPQPVRQEATRGPTPILPPAFAHGRADAASVTGGYVYHGSRLPELRGMYLYGDYVTGKVWGLRYAEGRVTEQRELTDTPLAIICFYEAADGEVALLDYNAGTVHRLVPNSATDSTAAFPRRLSETGLFISTAEHSIAPGVVPYSIHAEHWQDGAAAERYVAFPDAGTMTMVRNTAQIPRGNIIPPGAVLVKTLSLETTPGDSASRRRIETQVLHYTGAEWQDNGGEWAGYTYVWNDAQTDAELAPASGRDLQFTLADPASPDGRRVLPWRIHSRAECYTCHNPWAGYRLGFTEAQLDRPHDYGRGPADQLATLEQLGLVSLPERHGVEVAVNGKQRKPLPTPAAMVSPADPAASHDDRARSYLHVNCAHCHRFGGGGTAVILLDRNTPLDQTRMLGQRPSQGTFNLPHPALVQPGDPYASVLYYRLAKTGRGHMPHIGPQQVDWDGLRLIHDWIAGLPHGELTNATQLSEAERLLNAPPIDGRTAALSEPYLALAVHHGVTADPARRSDPAWRAVLQQGGRHADPIIRDLFEQFLPAQERVQRLGPTVDAGALLRLAGDAERGRELYQHSQTLLCRNCHRVGERGPAVGPELTTIGKLRSRGELLESILDPSKKVDPQFVTYVLETKAGLVHSGLLIERTETQVSLRTAENKRIDVPAAEIEQFAPQQRSLMPDLLYRDLTAAELADLLAYLESLR